ncbi:MAG: DNA repair protein RadA [Alphaproteobacteria bacterium]|nr:MAG: DNA repair protein RadA [Alphaproteobacteria bacterium]
MARPAAVYVCQSCGSSHNRWAGKCEACGEWNSIVEESMKDQPPQGLGRARGKVIELAPLSGASEIVKRRKTGIEEFDRVTGGGLVPGSALLIGGDPGIGKSTLLLQVTALLSKGARCAYISGEESLDQVRMRALRLGLNAAPVELASATNVRDIIETIDKKNFDAVVIDSIQTMYLDNLDSAPGTVAQVRATAAELIRAAKRRGACLLIVGHVTKEGQIAGPRVLEHMVDTVLYFEGDRGHTFRILRAVKNRFGPTDEIGVFEMAEAGLVEVPNPSELFLSQRQQEISGSAVFAGMEGTRPVLVEIQALVAPSPLGTPRRAVIGWDQARLSMVLAVLEARCGVTIGPNDVYLNVAGGLRIAEPAADLAVAAALVSSLSGVPVPQDMVVFGEVGLSGEVRNVGQVENRLKEAYKLGFRRALIPGLPGKKPANAGGLTLVQPRQLKDILPLFAEGEG